MHPRCDRWRTGRAGGATLVTMRVPALFDLGPTARRIVRTSRLVTVFVLVVGLGPACRSPATANGAASPPGPVSPTDARAVAPVAGTTGPARALPSRAADACDGGHISALAFVPGNATMVIGLDVAALSRHPEYTSRRAIIETGEFGRWIAAAGECGLGREHWHTVTFASDPSGSDRGTAVIRVSGIGDRGRLQCMRNRLADKEGKAPFDLVEGTKRLELSLSDEGRAWAVDPCTLVVATKTAVESTRTRLEGSGPPLLAGPISTVVARAGDHHHVWFALSSPQTATMLPGMIDWSSSLDLHGGFAFSTMVQFNDAQAAASATTQTKQTIDAFRSMATSAVPVRVLDTIVVGSTDRFMAITVRGDGRELTSIVDGIIGAVGKFSGP